MKELDPGSVLAAATATSITPLFGEYKWIVFFAVLGSLVALSRVKATAQQIRNPRRRWYDGALFVFRNVAVASAFVGIISSWLSKLSGLPASQFLWPVSFGIAWLGEDNLLSVRDRVLEKITGKK